MPLDLTIALPDRIFHHESIIRIRAFGSHGEFCILPRHIDCVSVLKRGIVTCMNVSGEKRLFAVDAGILVKQGSEVMLSTPRAIRAEDEETLRSEVSAFFSNLEERERKTRSALRKIEADFVRTLVDSEEDGASL